MAYDVGQKVRLPVTVLDDTGALSNATMSIVVTRPDDTIFTAPTIVNESTGKYHADVIVDQAGLWQYVFTAAGAVIAVYSAQFFVRSGGPRIISLKEAKSHLNKNQTVTVDDEELRDFIDMTTVLIENVVGAVVPRTVTEFYSGGSPAIFLRETPILSVTTVQETWGVGDVRTLTKEPDLSVGATNDQYQLDIPKGVLLRRDSGWTQMFPYGDNNIKVVYRSGRSPIPENIRMASKEAVAHMWRMTQLSTGGSRARVGGDQQQQDTISRIYALPARVREMLGKKRAPRLGA